MVVQIPQWIFYLHQFRQSLFLNTIEPLIVFIFGPVVEDAGISTLINEDIDSNNNVKTVSTHRHLGFLPNYVEDVSSFHETSMSFATLVMLFVIMMCLAIVFLSCFYHNQKTSPLFISPRRHRLPKLVPPPLPVDGTFSWVKVCFYISDEEIINRVGFDSLIFLRFHRLALRCIVKMSVFSFFVLLPINFTGGGHLNGADLKGYVGSLLFTDFLRFTMANVTGGSPRLWVHCLAAYLLSAIVMRELVVEYNAFHSIRHRYLLSKEPHLRTVLVTNIPRHLRAPKKIHNYFKHVYPDAVKSVTTCQNLIHLEKLVAKRTYILLKIERELLLLCKNEKRKLLGQSKLQRCGRAPFTCFESIGLVDGTQERLAKLYSKLETLNDAVQKEQERRSRVMQKMDKMEAGKGRKDIDYILASPSIDEESLLHKEHFIVSKVCKNQNLSYIPPSLGNEKVVNLSNNNKDVNDGEKDKNNSDYSILPNYCPGNTDKENNRKFCLHSEDDINRKIRNNKKSFLKARQAIKRYSKSVRNVNLLSRPKRTLHETISHFSGEKSKTDHIENHTNEVTDKAFIQMKTFTASTIAIQSMHSSKPGAMQVITAPEPRDVLWENIYVSKGAKRTRGYIAETLVILLITFYVFPIALVSLLVSESALVSSSPRLAQLDKASALFSTAIALVQPLCLVGIQQLLPPLFIQISKAEGILAFSEVQMKAFSRYFMFQVLNIFLVTSIAGSIFDTIAIIVENPETAFEMLGNSLPRMSSFFVTFVMMKCFLGLGIELVRIMSLVQTSLRYLLFPNSTLREKRRVRIGMRAIDDPGWFPFHKILAQDMVVVVISVVFAVVAPMVLLPCALFCLFSRIMWTHHHLFVYESVFESGGQFWPKIFRRFVFGLIIAQMTITGQFILKEARHEAYATIALMFLTYFFLRSTRARYDAPSSTLPLEVAAVMDITVRQEEEAKCEVAGNVNQQQRYEHNESCEYDHRKMRVTFQDNMTVVSDPETHITDMTETQLGRVIGLVDPFEHAYIQPALRATPRARPEQPFPPAQLGREEVLLQKQSNTHNVEVDQAYDERATVRLKSLNQNDRKLVNNWWIDQFQSSGKQSFFSVLVGEESGTLKLGRQFRNNRNKIAS